MDRTVSGRSLRAYTLIEVMIVVFILGVVAAMALPMLGETRSARLQAAAELLAADVNFAQLDSVAHSDDPRLIVFNTASHSYYLATVSTPERPMTHPVGKGPYLVQFGVGRAAESAGVRIVALSVGGDDQLRFGTFGQLDQAAPATVTLGLDQLRQTVTIDPINAEVTIGAPFTQ